MKRVITLAVATVVAAGAGFGAAAAAGWPSPASATWSHEPPAADVPALGRVLYGETVYAGDDGATRTVVWQHGKVTAVSDSAVTVRSTDGTEWAWTINRDTKVYKDGKTGSASDVATGDTVRVTGERAGDTRTAATVADPPRDFGDIRERLGDLPGLPFPR